MKFKLLFSLPKTLSTARQAVNDAVLDQDSSARDAAVSA